MPVLSVRAWTANADRHLVGVTDLSFTKTAPGGHATCSFKLPAWVDRDDPALVNLARVKVYDTRTGETVWGAGYLEQPGRTVGDDGHTWDVGVVGPTALLTDRSLSYIMVDRGFDGWEFGSGSNTNFSADVAGHPTDENQDCLLFRWPEGTVVGPASRVSMRYRQLANSSQRLGGISIRHKDGNTLALSRAQVLTNTRGGAPDTVTVIDDAWSATETPLIIRSAGASGSHPVGHNIVTIRSERAGTLDDAYNVTSDLSYMAVTEVVVQGLRFTKTGGIVSGASSYAVPVTAGMIVADMVWRFPELVDKVNADINPGTHDIDQLAYTDAVTMADVLGDLGLFEPNLYHYIGASDTTDLHSFFYRTWRTSPRYEADTVDGFTQPGGEVDSCNRVVVTWTDRAGNVQSLTATLAVPELDALGRVRYADPVEVGFELGSDAAATRIGARLLEEAKNPPRACTLTVARPVRDLQTGRMVRPHELEPGERVRVRDIDLTLPCVEVDYDDDTESATLSLGRPPLTADQLLNRIERRRNRRR